MLTNFCQLKGLASWEVVAEDACRLLEFVAARIFHIQFAQRYVICKYGVGITFDFFLGVKQAAQCGMQG